MTSRPGTVFRDRYGLGVSWLLSRRKSDFDTLFDADAGVADAGVDAGGGGGRATFQRKLSEA